jgi:ribonuclease-3
MKLKRTAEAPSAAQEAPAGAESSLPPEIYQAFFASIQPSLFELAITHRSVVPGAPERSNERLEFLGDAVLGMVIGEYLFKTFPKRSEGELARARGIIVRKSALADAAVRIGMPNILKISRAEAAGGGRERATILADAFEAVLAAVYLSHGFESAKQFILSALDPVIKSVGTRSDWRDAKTVLQEIRQGNGQSPPVYETVAETGQAHDRTFTVHVLLDGACAGEGVGKNKREAQLAAAAAALDSEGTENAE